MNQLVRTELLKQRTTRVPVAGICAAPMVAGLITFAILNLSGKNGNDPLGPDSLAQIIGGPAGVTTVIAGTAVVAAGRGDERQRGQQAKEPPKAAVAQHGIRVLLRKGAVPSVSVGGERKESPFPASGRKVARR